MKKLLLTLASCLLASMSFATPIHRPTYSVEKNKQPLSAEKQSLHAHTGLPSQPLHSIIKRVSPTRSEETASPIYEAPEGVTREYVRDAWGFFIDYTFFGYGGSGSKATHIVEGNDGFYYIYNPICRFNTKTYLKCEKKGNKLIASLPQCVYSEYDDDYNEWLYYLAIYNKIVDEEGEFWYEIDNNINEVTFTIDDNGNISMDLDKEPSLDEEGNYVIPERILGLGSDDGSWYCLGDNIQNYTPFTKSLVELPSDAKIENWILESKYWGWGDQIMKWVEVAVVGDELYLSGLDTQYLPQAWIKGKIEGDKVVFTSEQYVGTVFGFYIYMYGGTITDDNVILTNELVFDYDRESSKLTTHENNELIFNGSTKIYDPLSEYENPVIRKQRTDINPMPKNPIIYYYDNCLEESGYSYLSFDLPEISIDNDLLDTNNMWYEVYIDDELYTFTPEMYMYLDEPMTKVPYNFIDDYDFIYWGNSRGIYFYVDVLNSIGLRLYNEFNGEVYASELVSCGEVSTIKQINSSEVESEEYYTLTGIRTNNPQNGIFIKRTHLANGKVTTEKVRK